MSNCIPFLNALNQPINAIVFSSQNKFSKLLTPMRCPRVTERPMEIDGDPTLSDRRASVVAKIHKTSWKVRIISTTRPSPGVVLLLS